MIVAKMLDYSFLAFYSFDLIVLKVNHFCKIV